MQDVDKIAFFDELVRIKAVKLGQFKVARAHRQFKLQRGSDKKQIKTKCYMILSLNNRQFVVFIEDKPSKPVASPHTVTGGGEAGWEVCPKDAEGGGDRRELLP